MGLIAGVVAAGVIAAGATAYAGSQQASATQDANAQNTNATALANRQNLILNLINRGEKITAQDASALGLDPSLIGTSSSVLPYYLSQQEPQLGANAANTSLAIQSLYGSPALEMQDYQNIIGQFQPSINQANQLGQNVISGATTGQMLQEEQPVATARTQLAQTTKDAAMQQLEKTLNSIDAIQSRKGYVGDSYGERMQKFNAASQIAQQGAASLGTAALQNALEKQGIQQSGRNLQLSNLGLPTSMAQNAISLKGLPSTATASRFQTSMAPVSNFNIGTGRFTPYQTPPLVGPVANTGQIIGQGIGQVGNSAGNFLANQSLANSLNSQPSDSTVNPANYATAGDYAAAVAQSQGMNIPPPQDFAGTVPAGSVTPPAGSMP